MFDFRQHLPMIRYAIRSHVARSQVHEGRSVVDHEMVNSILVSCPSKNLSRIVDVTPDGNASSLKRAQVFKAPFVVEEHMSRAVDCLKPTRDLSGRIHPGGQNHLAMSGNSMPTITRRP